MPPRRNPLRRATRHPLDAVWIEMVRMLNFLCLRSDQESGNLMLKAIGFWFYYCRRVPRAPVLGTWPVWAGWTEMGVWDWPQVNPFFAPTERMALRSREIRMTQTADIKPFWLEDGATLYNDLCIQRQFYSMLLLLCWVTTLDIVYNSLHHPFICPSDRQANQLETRGS